MAFATCVGGDGAWGVVYAAGGALPAKRRPPGTLMGSWHRGGARARNWDSALHGADGLRL